jgi:hypothetical protein
VVVFQKPIQQPKRNRRNNQQVYRRNRVSMIAKEGLPALPPSLAMYFATVVWSTSMPSLSTSPD